ncbi:MAG TPA: 50S ribosomal protein L24 [Nitrospiria bacterium]|nr:50S ribosomal protein L24 [Nitrospiria bacterium]
MNTIEIPSPRVRIKKGDTVKVISGREKGKEGKVLQVLSKEAKIKVEKLNMIKKHQKPTQKNTQGGIVEKEAAIAISNVMLVCTRCLKLTRVGMKVLENGKKIRICKKCGEGIDRD